MQTDRESAFHALVVIDELEEELETLLLSRFKFPVEVLTLRRFKTLDGRHAYEFDPFLADLAPMVDDSTPPGRPSDALDPSEIDTIVVPAQEEGFRETFLGENRWYQIRIHASMKGKIKYIAAYQSQPVSAITHIAPVKNIDVWQDTNKYVLTFSEPAKPIGPLKLVPKPNGRVRAPQAPRYTSHARLLKAATLDEVF